jgi:HipA-like protein
MKKFLKKILFNSTLQNSLNKTTTEDLEYSVFNLKYNNQKIGKLTFDNGTWYFEYSDWYKNQEEFRPLIEFPNKDKQYQSKELWTFFSSRIPSLKQPKVQEFININKDKVAPIELLKKFGKTSINNPYKLDCI